VSAGPSGLERLTPDARARLERFGQALEHVRVDDLPLYAVRPPEPDHGLAVAEASARSLEVGLGDALASATGTFADYILQQYGQSQFRMSWMGMNSAPGLGPTDDRVRVFRSLGDAVTALVLWDALDESDRAELLEAWANLI
jgi:hypothetical protein